MKKEILLIALVIFVGASGYVFAEDPKSSNEVKNAAEVVKKTRKKRVEMCPECGKPEAECECHKDTKKEEKK